MTKEKALKLLNLIEPFTEDDLNKAFRSLTNKWHPDKFASDTPEYIQTQEKMTELNIARDTLKKILKERDKNYTYYARMKKIRDRDFKMQLAEVI